MIRKFFGGAGFRAVSVGALLALVGCSAIETERRPTAGTRYLGQGLPIAATERAQASIVASETVAPADAPSIYADSAILIDASTGRTVWAKNADQRRQVASTQKLLTGLMVAERGNLDGQVTVQPADTRAEPTKLYVKAGETYARRPLLTTLMVKSCNDVADLLARDHSGSPAAFAQAMNRRAASLGATSSYFVNPHGLPGSQYSTARDVGRIAFAAYRNSDLRSMMRLPSYTFRYQDGRTKTLEATNKLLKTSSMYNGMKTGYTVAAGRCLVTSASFGGRSLILVQLGSKTSYIFDDADRMMRWGFSQGGGGLFSSL
ncbi:MAG: D-alanyl-D-alanine carboxypeptidase [Chthoniobacterales bacterium]